jgi:hypothetical protein
MTRRVWPGGEALAGSRRSHPVAFMNWVISLRRRQDDRGTVATLGQIENPGAPALVNKRSANRGSGISYRLRPAGPKPMWINVCCRARAANYARLFFPRSNGLDYDFDAGHCGFEFTLHALNLGFKECLHPSTPSRRPPASSRVEIVSTTDTRRILPPSTLSKRRVAESTLKRGGPDFGRRFGTPMSHPFAVRIMGGSATCDTFGAGNPDHPPRLLVPVADQS